MDKLCEISAKIPAEDAEHFYLLEDVVDGTAGLPCCFNGTSLDTVFEAARLNQFIIKKDGTKIRR